MIGPSYKGARPSRARVGVDINQTVVEQARFIVGCSGVTLQDVQKTSPPGGVFKLHISRITYWFCQGMMGGTIIQSSTNSL